MHDPNHGDLVYEITYPYMSEILLSEKVDAMLNAACNAML